MELKALGDDAVDSILVHLAEDVHDLLHFSRQGKALETNNYLKYNN